jgi:hypothetical protein
MKVVKLSRNTKISKSFILLYAKSGFGKTSSLLNIDWSTTVYISTETGFRVLQGLLQFIEGLYEQAIKSSLETVFEALKEERPELSKQLIEVYKNAVKSRIEKPKDYVLEIDHIHIEIMNDLYNPVILDAYNEAGNAKSTCMFNGIDMSKKDTIIIDTITHYSEMVVKERSLANKTNPNKYATWIEHSIAVKKLLDELVLARGIKIVIGHEAYDKDLKKKSLSICGDNIKNDITGRFNVILYGTEISNTETGEVKRVFVTNPDVLTEKADAKSQDPRLSEIESMDLSIVLNKLKS